MCFASPRLTARILQYLLHCCALPRPLQEKDVSLQTWHCPPTRYHCQRQR